MKSLNLISPTDFSENVSIRMTKWPVKNLFGDETCLESRRHFVIGALDCSFDGDTVRCISKTNEKTGWLNEVAIGSLLRTAPLRTHTPTQLRWRDKIVDKASVCQRALRKPPLFQNYYQRVSKLLQRIMPCTYRRKHVIVDIGCQTKYSRTGGDIMSGKCPEHLYFDLQFRQLIIFGELKLDFIKCPLRQIPSRIF